MKRRITPLFCLFVLLFSKNLKADGEKSTYFSFRVGSGYHQLRGDVADREVQIKALGYQEHIRLISVGFGIYWMKFNSAVFGISFDTNIRLFKLNESALSPGESLMGFEFLYYPSGKLGEKFFLGGKVGFGYIDDGQYRTTLGLPAEDSTAIHIGPAVGLSIGYGIRFTPTANFQISLDPLLIYESNTVAASILLRGGIFF